MSFGSSGSSTNWKMKASKSMCKDCPEWAPGPIGPQSREQAGLTPQRKRPRTARSYQWPFQKEELSLLTTWTWRTAVMKDSYVLHRARRNLVLRSKLEPRTAVSCSNLLALRSSLLLRSNLQLRTAMSCSNLQLLILQASSTSSSWKAQSKKLLRLDG